MAHQRFQNVWPNGDMNSPRLVWVTTRDNAGFSLLAVLSFLSIRYATETNQLYNYIMVGGIGLADSYPAYWLAVNLLLFPLHFFLCATENRTDWIIFWSMYLVKGPRTLQFPDPSHQKGAVPQSYMTCKYWSRYLRIYLSRVGKPYKNRTYDTR